MVFYVVLLACLLACHPPPIPGAWLRPTADKTGVEVTPFDSIPTAMYWVVVNTGDLVPTSDGGK
jgi:hypothetical protein